MFGEIITLALSAYLCSYSIEEEYVEVEEYEDEEWEYD